MRRPSRRCRRLPSTPDSATLAEVADHLADIIATGTPNQRTALVGAGQAHHEHPLPETLAEYYLAETLVALERVLPP